LSKNRHGRFCEAGIFRLLFEQTVRHCVEAGLVGGNDAAIDASFVSADASWQHKMRDADLDVPQLARPVREWLADQATAAAQEHGVPRGEPAFVSRTDPAAAWAARTAKGRFGYAFNVMVDTPGGVAMEVEASPARFAAEVDAGRAMLAHAGDRHGYRPKRVAADTAYGSGAFLAFFHDRGTVPHIPVLERSEQTKGKFPRGAFRYEREQDRYVCPAGKVLRFAGMDQKAGVRRYSATPPDCRACDLKPKCASGAMRPVTHSQHEDVRELVRAEMQKPLFKRSMRLRRGIERVFADAQGKRGLARLHLRGLRGAEEEFLLGAAVANLVLLARSAARTARSQRAPSMAPRIDRMARISRNRFERSCHAATP
jgi:hypothetical protein